MHYIIKVIAILSMGISISATAGSYIPDLFGAYMQGAEMARAQNQRDAYYYAQRSSRPAFYFDVYEQGKHSPKSSLFGLRISLKKQDALCWSVYPLANGATYKAEEYFQVPDDTTLDALSETSYNKIDSMYWADANHVEITRVMTVRENGIESCWVFNPQTTKKGKYYIKVRVMNSLSKTYAFTITD